MIYQETEFAIDKLTGMYLVAEYLPVADMKNFWKPSSGYGWAKRGSSEIFGERLCLNRPR